MGQGKAISEPVQWIVIQLSSILSNEDVSTYTGVSQHTVQRILHHFNQTSYVILPKDSRGQPCTALCDYDVEVCQSQYPAHFTDLHTSLAHV